MATRYSMGILFVSLGATALFFGCSGDAKYRLLSFFFDGVPVPGTQSDQDRTAGLPGSGAASTDAAEQRSVVREKYYTHTAYAQNRCASCHNLETGRLFRSPEEGLCQSCHTDPPGEARFLHGPVAVNACLFCHDHHVGPFPSATLLDVPDLCYECHLPEDLSTGTHHDTPDPLRCTTCHSPHGGDDRFFLKRPEP